ncbi:hypothetical protein CASFOL_033734 [Castilleja foliolosa]|uniref:RING-type domain-containing protein n=1 Tax=Castilleja foliolosa TaxID=1961234 RepID=A0ABD3BYN9_9LAMI
MGGSRKGKDSKGNGKSKPNKSDTIREKPKKLNPKLDLGQASSKNLDFSNTIPYVEWELEEFLYVKINELYKTAQERLLTSGYSTAEIEAAILNAGHIHGQMDLLDNIVSNSICFLEFDIKPEGEAFKNIYELYKTALEVLVDHTMQNHPNMNRPEAMWDLIVTRWDHVLSASKTSHLQSSGHCENGDDDDDDGLIEAFAAAKFIHELSSDSLSKKVGVLETTNHVAATKREIGAPIVTGGKTEKNCSEMSLKLLETARSLGQANTEASLVNDALKRLEIENDRIRAEVAAFNLNASESERELKQVLKREKRYTKKLADVERQSSVLRSLCDEENQRAVELEQGLFLAEKEAKETEGKWKQKIKEKEEMLALLAQETKNAETRKASSRAQLKKLRKQLKKECGLANDKCQQLKSELSHLRESHSRPLEELSGNLYDKATSSESSAPCEPSHWVCVICMQNEVSVVFLPCTHQVVCFLCYMKKGQAAGSCCPCCDVVIEDIVKVYGSSS